MCLLSFLSACEEPTGRSEYSPDASTDASPGTAQGEGGDGAVAWVRPVTYQRDLRPVIETSCLPCHSTGGSAPFALDSWSAVQALAPAAVHAVLSRAMPPFPADESCRELHGAGALSEQTRALFAAWRADGFPQGDEAQYAAAAPHGLQRRDRANIVMSPELAYTPPANSDEYRCFVLGRLDADTYLEAISITPEQREQVHHAQIHLLSQQQLAAVAALDGADPALGYTCPTGSGVSSQVLYSYRPGSDGVQFEAGDAALIEQGSTLLLQVHYNSVFPRREALPKPDRTSIALWTLPPGQLPAHVLYRTGATATVTIPAGAPQSISRADSPLRMLSSFGSFLGFGGSFVAGEIVGIAPHAHHLAKRLAARLTRGDGSAECLIDVPHWDFHVQLDYLYQRGVGYGPDDRLEITCEYDNSAAQQPVVDGVRQSPRDVVWGEKSSDEMCLFYLWLRFDRETFLHARSQLGSPP
jgi:hypothetical protein